MSTKQVSRTSGIKKTRRRGPVKKFTFGISMDPELCKKLDANCGVLSRSSAVCLIIQNYLEEKEKRNDESGKRHHDHPLIGGLL